MHNSYVESEISILEYNFEHKQIIVAMTIAQDFIDDLFNCDPTDFEPKLDCSLSEIHIDDLFAYSKEFLDDSEIMIEFQDKILHKKFVNLVQLYSYKIASTYKK